VLTPASWIVVFLDPRCDFCLLFAARGKQVKDIIRKCDQFTTGENDFNSSF
jgi:hypothetical protein